MGQEEELKLVITAEQRADREIDRLTRKLTDFSSRINKAFSTPLVGKTLNSPAVSEAFKKYGQGISQINERHTRWANNEKRLGRMTAENWRAMNAELEKYVKKDGTVRQLRGKQIEQFIELTRRARAYEQVWMRQHDRYLSSLRRENEISDQLARAKERRQALNFVNEQRRRANIDALDRQRSRAYLADLKRREQAEVKLGNQRSAAYLRQIRAEEVARVAEERRRQRLKINSWALQMRQDEAARRAQDRADAAAHRDRERRWGNRASAASSIPGSIVQGTTSIAIAGAVVEAAVAKLVMDAFSVRRSTDRAETNLMMFGGLDRAGVESARSGWLNSAAMANGFKPAAAINAFTEVLKAGIPEAVAPAVTQSIMGAAAGMDLNVAETTKLVGRLSTLTQGPNNFNPGAIDTMLNSMAVVAKVTAADTQELVSALRRGAGVLGSSKMSVGELAAFTGAGISAGMQEGKAGTFMDFTVNELVNARNARGQRRADLAKGLQLAGLGSLQKVSREAANDPATLLQKLFQKMASSDPQKAGQIASLIFMREWRGEALQMAAAAEATTKALEAVRGDTTNKHLRDARNLRLGSIDGVLSQLNAVFAQLQDAAGKGLEPTFRAISNFLIEFGKGINPKVIQDHIEVLIEGITTGFGGGTIPEILESLFGKPGEFNTDTLGKWLLFGRGMGKALREFFDTIKSLLPTGGMSAETLGYWTTSILTWSQAIQAARPAIDLLTTFFSTLGTLFQVVAGATVANTLIRALAGGGGAAAGGGGLGALLGTIVGGMVTVSIGAISSLALSSWWGWRNPSQSGVPDEKKSPIEKKPEDRQWWEGIPGMPMYDKMGYRGEGDRKNLIHKAAYTPLFDDRADAMDRLAQTMGSMGARVQLASLGGSVSSGIASTFGGGGGGSVGGGVGGLGSNFFDPKMRVPGWYGKRSGGGGGGRSGGAMPGIPESIPMTAAERNTLGLIMKYESGGQNKMNYVGKGQGLDPTTPKGYTAQGYFQMLNSNWRRIAPLYGIKTPNAMASSLEDQTKVALHLLRNGGVKNWANYNPKLRAALARGEIAPTGGIPEIGSPGGAAAAVSGGVHPLDGKGRFTSGFGMRWHPKKGGWKMHNGIDLAAPAGTAVKSMKAGVVTVGNYGDTTIKHPDGTSTVYRHVVPSVQSGQNVAAGQIIARLRANDPRSTGPHLHLESKDANGRFMDPKHLLGAANSAVASVNGTVAAGRRANGSRLDGEFSSTGWKPGLGGNAAAFTGVPDSSPAQKAIQKVPMPPKRPGGLGGGAGGGGGVTIMQHIHGAGSSPEEVANLAQRKITEDWNHRSHDLEPELT